MASVPLLNEVQTEARAATEDQLRVVIVVQINADPVVTEVLATVDPVAIAALETEAPSVDLDPAALASVAQGASCGCFR